MKSAFTLIELIVTIVIIGVLSAVAIPQFRGLIDSTKISSELATAASVQTTLDTIHSDWVLNGANCQFDWGNEQRHLDGNNLNNNGYPTALDDGTNALGWLFRESDFVHASENRYYGPASNPDGGTNRCQEGKPCIGKYWEYNSTNGTFLLVKP